MTRATLVVALALVAVGCAPVRVVDAETAARELCDGADAWPLVLDGGRLFVDATVELPSGPAPLRLMIDTGGNAMGVALHGRAAARLGVRDAGALPRELVVGGRRAALPDGASWVLVDDASPGSLLARARPGESDGQIGAGWLSRRRLCLDPAARRLGLGAPSDARVSAGGGHPLVLAEEAPWGARYGFLRADVGRSSVTLLVDTGAPAGMLHERAHSSLIATSPWAEVASGDWDMIAGAYAAERVVAAPLSLGGARLGPAVFVSRPDGTFPTMFTALPGGGPDGALGADVWLRHRVLVDWDTERLFAWPVARQGALPARVPISIAFDARGCPTVARAASEAAREGLAPGDRLVRIEGRDPCGVGHAELSRWLGRPEGAQISIERGRGARVEPLVVTSRPALPRAATEAQPP